jgi:RNA polymerase-binding transcription factor DksA
LTDDKWDNVRTKLEAEQEETLAEISRLSAVLKSELEADLEDGDPDLVEREKTLALLRNLEDKQYEISPERLQALPYATLCLQCKAMLERGVPVRPAEPSSL